MSTKETMVHQQWIGTEGNDIRLACPCGEYVWLHFNGGELDSSHCQCGRFFYSQTPLIQVWMHAPKEEAK